MINRGKNQFKLETLRHKFKYSSFFLHIIRKMNILDEELKEMYYNRQAKLERG